MEYNKASIQRLSQVEHILKHTTGGGKSSYPAVDVFKFVAAILVVAIHSRPFVDNIIVDYYFTCFCRVAVPFFFCFSSYIFFMSEKKSIAVYIKRILTIYVTWFIIELPLVYIRFFNTESDMLYQILHFVRKLSIQNTFYASWFLTASWQAMLIVFIFIKHKKEKMLIVLSIICFIVALFDGMYNGVLRNTFLEKPDYILNILLEPANSFVVAIPYMTLGYYMSRKNHTNCFSLNKVIIALMLFVAILFVETYCCKSIYNKTDAFLSLIPITAFLIYILTSINMRLNKKLALFMRQSSILIYLSHTLFIHLLGYFGIARGALCFMCTLILSITFSSLVIYGSTKFKLLKNLY